MTKEDFSDPVAVWLAAEGDPSELVTLLAEHQGRLPKRTQYALAAWISGAYDKASNLKDASSRTLTSEVVRRERAAVDYCRNVAWLREREATFDADGLADQVAKKWDVSLDALQKGIATIEKFGLRDDLEIEARAYQAWRRNTSHKKQGAALS